MYTDKKGHDKNDDDGYKSISKDLEGRKGPENEEDLGRSELCQRDRR